MMRLALVFSRTIIGIKAPLVTVEAHISPGLPGFSIVGLAETAVKESRERVRSAIINSGFEFPARKIIINLAPADLPKQGSKFDLPIALSILAATDQISKNNLMQYEFVGELALTGELRSIENSLPIAIAAMKQENPIVIPKGNGNDFLPEEAKIYLARDLKDVCALLEDKTYSMELYKHNNVNLDSTNEFLDFKDVYGQNQAKRALTIAAAGKHNVLMVGAPGAGKTMLAKRIMSILPELKYEEKLEIASIYSIKNPQKNLHYITKPFIAPHHTASYVSLVGGGTYPKPGEISMAHNGVLFLDELLEFDKKVIESLREPLENKEISISRAKMSFVFPANFQLIAAMNPCPCGYFGIKNKECICQLGSVKKYLNKLSGPILDRIDIKLHISPVSVSNLLKQNAQEGEGSETLKRKVFKAYLIQQNRHGKPNSELSNQEMKTHCKLSSKVHELLEDYVKKFSLSARACNKAIKVSRTIADLEESKNIELNHLAESLSYSTGDKINNLFN